METIDDGTANKQVGLESGLQEHGDLETWAECKRPAGRVLGSRHNCLHYSWPWNLWDRGIELSLCGSEGWN